MNPMNRAEAREFIKSNPQLYLKKARRKGYICPLCNNGTGENGDGIIVNSNSLDGRSLKCFKCGFSGDMINLIARERGIENCNSVEAFDAAYEAYGIEITNDQNSTHYKQQTQNKQRAHITDEKNTNEATQEAQPVDYTDYFRKCAANLSKTDYHKKRGISDETARRFNVGYDERWQSLAAIKRGINPPTSPRLIIPTSPYSFLARDTRPDAPKQYAKMKEGPLHTFNSEALYNGTGPIFVVEGEIDALSILQVGADAVALGSTCRVAYFIKELSDRPTDRPIYIALDKDERGEEAALELASGLARANIQYMDVDISGEHKDVNEALIADGKKLREKIRESIAIYDSAKDKHKHIYNGRSETRYINHEKLMLKDKELSDCHVRPQTMFLKRISEDVRIIRNIIIAYFVASLICGIIIIVLLSRF